MKSLIIALVPALLLLALPACKKEKKRKVVKVNDPIANGAPGTNNGNDHADPQDKYPELSMTISDLRSHYYDPTKLKAEEMLYAGLDELQASVAPVAYKKLGKGTFSVQVDQSKKTFSTESLDNMGKLRDLSTSVLDFVLNEIEKHGGDAEEKEDALYNFVNGFLRALDPYSVLIKPKYTDELKMQTRGAYGGVGMVLSIRDDELTVIKPQPGGPAIEQGIKKDDKIVQIDDRSTVNMPLTEAVNMIRGMENTVVNIWIKRKTGKKDAKGNPTWTKPANYPLKRRRIRIESVVSKMLNDGKGNIAYFRINHFISHTASDLMRQYQDLLKKHKAINGIVLDLVDNPGGLLRQAIYVANAFLQKGVIVSTEGAPGTLRREFSADDKNTLTTKTPMVVLISSGSASASEIVSGTLKNLDRALLIGDTTFGKGTVQQIFTKGPKQPILKLTIQQYLTAGNVSIQQVGVVPHVRYTPIGMLPGYSLFWPDKPRKTSKRTKAIKSDKVRPPEKPRYELRYYRTVQEKRNYTNSVEDNRADSDLIQFAYDVLLHHGKSKASQTLDSISAFMDQRVKLEERKMEQDLKKNWKIDWSSGPVGAGKPALETKVSFCHAKDITKDRRCKKEVAQILPGEKAAMIIQVTNKGTTTLSRLYAIAESPSYILDTREFLFGAVKPGAFRYWTSEFSVPKRTSVVIEPITIQMYQRGRGVIETIKKNLHIQALPKPQFQISWALREKNGGDSIAQKGEQFILDMKVTNIGKGTSTKPKIAITDRSEGHIFLREGRHYPATLAPGTSSYAHMTYEVKDASKPISVELSVYDRIFRKSVSRKVVLPVGPRQKSTPQKSLPVMMLQNSKIWASAEGKGHLVATATGPFRISAMVNGLCRVTFEEKLTGFAKCTQAASNGPKVSPSVTVLPHIVPPMITLDAPPVAITKAPSIRITGKAYHPENIKDFYILVTNFDTENGRRKVFFAAGKGKELKFNSEIPLDLGLNHVLLIARHDVELRGHYLFSVVREK